MIKSLYKGLTQVKQGSLYDIHFTVGLVLKPAGPCWGQMNQPGMQI